MSPSAKKIKIETVQIHQDPANNHSPMNLSAHKDLKIHLIHLLYKPYNNLLSEKLLKNHPAKYQKQLSMLDKKIEGDHLNLFKIKTQIFLNKVLMQEVEIEEKEE